MCFLIVLQTRLLIVIVAAYSYSLAVRLTYSSIRQLTSILLGPRLEYPGIGQNSSSKQYLEQVVYIQQETSLKTPNNSIQSGFTIRIEEQVKVSKGSYGFIYISGLEAQNLVNIRVPIRNRCSSDIKGSGIIQRQ